MMIEQTEESTNLSGAGARQKERAMSDTATQLTDPTNVTDATPEPTLDAIREAMEEAWRHVSAVAQNMGLVLDAGPDAGGWTPRQVLSHIVGAWQRVPIHASFFLAGCEEVPIQLGDDYWMPEWRTAPLEAFLLAIETAYEGSSALLHRLDATALAIRAQTPFGEVTLGEILLTSYHGHIDRFHLPQLRAFLSADQPTES
jgi:hypothetical protein